MREHLMMMGVIYGARYHRQEKEKLKQQLWQDYQQAGWHIQEIVNGSSRHWYASKKKRVKTIFVVPYDTPLKNTRKGESYYPFSVLRKKQQAWLDLVGQLVSYVCLALLIAGAGWFAFQTTGYLRLFGVLVLVIMGALGFRLSQGRSSKNNMNLNSASLALIRHLLFSFKGEAYGVLYLDRYYDHQPWEQTLAKIDKPKDATIVLLEGLAYGETLIIRTPHETPLTNQLTQQFPNSEIQITKQAYIHLLKGQTQAEEIAIFPARTEEDYRVDVNFLETLSSVLANYIGD